LNAAHLKSLLKATPPAIGTRSLAHAVMPLQLRNAQAHVPNRDRQRRTCHCNIAGKSS